MKSSREAADLRADLSYLYSLNNRGIKPGLSRIQKLLAAIGNPQNAYKIVHIAGTNGKGSTCAIIASILRSAGLRVGLYTSPHLLRFNERIRVDDLEIGDRQIAQFIRHWRKTIDELDCSFFEATTALAFDYFKKQKAEYVVLETGMGGRFDATNVVQPEVTVITPVARDHQEFLGRRLNQIAFEKAGIVKSGAPCIVAHQTAQVRKYLTAEIRARAGDLYYAVDQCRIKATRAFADYRELNLSIGNFTIERVTFPLIGAHQLVNLQAAVTAVTFIKNITITTDILRKGIAAVIWPGRLQILHRNPLIYYDVGHNQHGIQQAVRTLLKTFPDRPIHLLLALGTQKNYNQIGKIIRPLGGTVCLTEIPDHPSVSAEILANSIRKAIPLNRIYVEKHLSVLLNILSHKLQTDELLLIIGSHYLAPTVLPFYALRHSV